MALLFKKKADRVEVDKKNLPKHIGIIMDGNGRWARKRGLPRKAGHRVGAETFEKIVDYCGNLGIHYLTFYAFSTENWKRPDDEVEALMVLLEDYLDNGLKKLAGKKTRIHFIGNREAFSPTFQAKMKHVEEETAGGKELLVNVALNYGGREELVHACQTLAKKAQAGEIAPEDISEEMISGAIYTAGQPDPDLIIRPSGELRVSNFLLWQSAYAEFWYSDILWPDFTEEDMASAILEYQKRNRRYGGV